MKNRILSVLMVLCMALALLPPPFAEAAKTAFSDVDASAYYADSVAWAVENGITNGTTATTFSPHNTCTIAQITTFLWRACGEPEPETDISPFNDIQPTDYFYKAALWAYDNGITVPDVNTQAAADKFSGSALCGRNVVVYYLWTLQNYPDAPTHAFDDVDSSTSLGRAVSWAVENGITNGTTNTTFSPRTSCTRAQIVTFLYRAKNAGKLGTTAYRIMLDGNGGIINFSSFAKDILKDNLKDNTAVTKSYEKLPFNIDADGKRTYYLLPHLTVSRENYTFQGWYTKDGIKVTGDTEVTKSGPHTLYAHWEKMPDNSYDVTLDANGGVISIAAINYTGERIEIPAKTGQKYSLDYNFNVTRDGYTFEGWYTEKDGGKRVTSETVVTQSGPRTLYAHWEAGKTGLVIDGVNVQRDARKIQDNLYYYCVNGDYSLYEECHYADIVKVIYQEFVDLFGREPTEKSGCALLLKLDPDSPKPNTNLLGNGYRIRMRQRSADGDKAAFAPIAVYELGHELTHYFYYTISSQRSDAPFSLFQTWNEETVCEAMALYMLNRLNGKVPHEYSINPLTEQQYLDYYYLSFDYPRNDEAMQSAVSPVMTLARFENELGTDAQVKAAHHPEVRYLYEVLIRYRDTDIKHLMDMYDYYETKGVSSYGKGYIDYEKWEKAYGETPNFISDLKKIQPEIKG